jgi:hypothetical protein
MRRRRVRITSEELGNSRHSLRIDTVARGSKIIDR